jgi:hypothetical protein
LPTHRLFLYCSDMPADPQMPRQIPPHVERELRRVLGWRDRPNPIDLYLAVRDALVEAEETGDEAAQPRPKL